MCETTILGGSCSLAAKIRYKTLRAGFFRLPGAVVNFLMGPITGEGARQLPVDERLMSELVKFTARTLETATPVPFGALIVETATGKMLMRAVNAVRLENDPSSHAELRAVRKATRKLKSPSLKGYTLYTTCEPCPMCMGNALWAGLDRVVFGATVGDANKHCRQIRIPAREVVRRSDMKCIVDGPLLRGECYSLFTHPNMLKMFAIWNPVNKAAGHD
jgi:tRNA(Arg) A34 adenosine deaminase TadA